MTRFNHYGGSHWNFGGETLWTSVRTRSEYNLDSHTTKIVRAIEQAALSLSTTIQHMNAGGSAAATHFARVFFATETVLSDVDRKLITHILVATLNGLKSRTVIKVGNAIPEDNRPVEIGKRGWVRMHTDEYVEEKRKREMAALNLPRKEVRPYHNWLAFLDYPSQVIRQSAIHIPDDTMAKDDDYIRHTLIHEATHKFAGTVDECYFDSVHPYRIERGARITKEEGLRNADSYAFFANLKVLATERAQREGLPNPFI